MPHLFGSTWNRRQLEAYASVDQLGGIKRYTLTDGFERDTEIIEIDSAGGLRFGIAPSRGLDIVWARHNHFNLCWRGENGTVHPAYFQESNFGWLRGFPGGLVTTCGLGSLGPPCEDQGEHFGIHDRISYTPAREVAAQTIWEGDECAFVVTGQLRQTRLFGDNLRLDRKITTWLGRNEILLEDTISNDGFLPAPAVILYHCNFGFPLLAPGAEVFVSSNKAVPRDEAAAAGRDRWMVLDPPVAGFPEQVFFHELQANKNELCRAGISNPELGLRFQMEFDRHQLPFLTQWRALASGAYALGLEPSNAPLASRANLRERNQLPMLEPGANTSSKLRFYMEVL